MGALFDVLSELASEVCPPPYIAVDSEIDFRVAPVKAVLRDYTPVNVMRMGWCNERGTGGRSRKAVVHAKCDRQIGKRQKGELLCGYKSKAKWGGDLYSVDEALDCPKCQQAAEGLERSLIFSGGYGWLT